MTLAIARNHRGTEQQMSRQTIRERAMLKDRPPLPLKRQKSRSVDKPKCVTPEAWRKWLRREHGIDHITKKVLEELTKDPDNLLYMSTKDLRTSVDHLMGNDSQRPEESGKTVQVGRRINEDRDLNVVEKKVNEALRAIEDSWQVILKMRKAMSKAKEIVKTTQDKKTMKDLLRGKKLHMNSMKEEARKIPDGAIGKLHDQLVILKRMKKDCENEESGARGQLMIQTALDEKSREIASLEKSIEQKKVKRKRIEDLIAKISLVENAVRPLMSRPTRVIPKYKGPKYTKNE